MTPEAAEALRVRDRADYAKNRERYAAKARAWMAKLSPEERQSKRKAEYRKYSDKILAALKERRASDADHRATLLKRKAKYKTANPHTDRAYKLSSKYGMTIAEYELRLAEQNGRCAICSRLPGSQRLSVDHCHTTGRVRGLLCPACNTAIGKLGDTAAGIAVAVEYLRRTGEISDAGRRELARMRAGMKGRAAA